MRNLLICTWTYRVPYTQPITRECPIYCQCSTFDGDCQPTGHQVIRGPYVQQVMTGDDEHMARVKLANVKDCYGVLVCCHDAGWLTARNHLAENTSVSAARLAILVHNPRFESSI